MKKYAVRVLELTRTALAPFGNIGKSAMLARFQIKESSGRSNLQYEGIAQGAEFIGPCERLIQHPVIVEASEPNESDLERWKENVVRRAMSQITL